MKPIWFIESTQKNNEMNENECPSFKYSILCKICVGIFQLALFFLSFRSTLFTLKYSGIISRPVETDKANERVVSKPFWFHQLFCILRRNDASNVFVPSLYCHDNCSLVLISKMFPIHFSSFWILIASRYPVFIRIDGKTLQFFNIWNFSVRNYVRFDSPLFFFRAVKRSVFSSFLSFAVDSFGCAMHRQIEMTGNVKGETAVHINGTDNDVDTHVHFFSNRKIAIFSTKIVENFCCEQLKSIIWKMLKKKALENCVQCDFIVLVLAFVSSFVWFFFFVSRRVQNSDENDAVGVSSNEKFSKITFDYDVNRHRCTHVLAKLQ